jgi:hypothetical protein
MRVQVSNFGVQKEKQLVRNSYAQVACNFATLRSQSELDIKWLDLSKLFLVVTNENVS